VPAEVAPGAGVLKPAAKPTKAAQALQEAWLAG